MLTYRGVLCACYLVRKFKFTPDEAIAWVKMCMPDSITGQQPTIVAEFEKHVKNIDKSNHTNEQNQNQKVFIAPPETPSGNSYRSAPRSRIRSAFGPSKANPMIQNKTPQSMSVRVLDNKIEKNSPPRPICPTLPCKAPRHPPRKIPHLVTTV